ncbi:MULTISPECIES: multidrug effflux MFS transporter [unclassified Chelatococcus]|uniref:multidrug effflux MFS transporter n=1 Tax=unclassified Chelatococcus TaxID=2638111 RepID=UPI001BD0327D|nr:MULTISPECIES: multidrug effflux MFS transporter [unclassified Chelatococcus]MBS7697089.1 multidrug effflux MFS transporter [Chelatococcus sp. YT9]MBX3556079.1 multidrug effflux MFS transporter [Chelatococcus sp.]
MPTVMTERYTAILGAFLVALGPVSLALYTPAMPTLVDELATSSAAIKLTITAYFIGYALAQLACGPLSDAYGRRPIAIGFFSLHLVGSLIALWSPSIGWLLAGRILQGTGAAAGVAISRAMVRDQFTGASSVRIMSLIGLMLAVGPALSPVLGGLTLSVFSWRALFVLMAIYAAAAIGVLLFATRETNNRPDPAMARPRQFMASYKTLLTDRAFLRAGFLLALVTGGLYTLATLLPFVLIGEVGLSPIIFGLGMMLQSGSYALGSLLTARFITYLGAERIISIGLCFTLTASLGFFIALFHEPSFVTVMVPVMLWAFGLALTMPGATTSALANFPRIAGAAAAMVGFLQIAGGLAGSAISAFFADPYIALMTIMPVMGLLAILVHFGLRSRS